MHLLVTDHVIKFMKVILIVMFIFSICVGIHTNIGWMSLYGSEFIEPWAEFFAGRPNQNIFPFWYFLIGTHVLVFSLIFLVKKPYFKTILFFFPLSFIIAFVLYDLLTSIFLIPFMIIWFVSLFKQYTHSLKR